MAAAQPAGPAPTIIRSWPRFGIDPLPIILQLQDRRRICEERHDFRKLHEDPVEFRGVRIVPPIAVVSYKLESIRMVRAYGAASLRFGRGKLGVRAARFAKRSQ